jgi:hypothetical protein
LYFNSDVNRPAAVKSGRPADRAGRALKLIFKVDAFDHFKAHFYRFLTILTNLKAILDHILAVKIDLKTKSYKF